jgi:hypothetical protein
MFFKLSGKVEYDGRVLVDITKRVNIVQTLLKNKDFYYDYVVMEGQTAETIAFDKLGDVKYYWIILLINEIYDPLYQWYMGYNEVIAYSKLKYGDPEYLHTKHWELNGVKYKTDPGGNALAISNLDYEIAVNDSKQTIKIPYSEYTEQIVREFRKLIK